MIIHLKKDTAEKQVQAMADSLEAMIVKSNGHITLVTSSKVKEVDKSYEGLIDDYFVFTRPRQPDFD